MPSDTYFTAPPEWHWLVVLYFFFGGIAGGSYAIAALLDLFGEDFDRPLARLGYYVAFAAVLLCPPLLIWDLNRPERFWHMLIQSERGLPMFKYWSPISFGSWILLIFSGFAFLALVGALAEAGRLPASLRVLRRGGLRRLIAAVGGIFGFLLAGYTGVLLSVTNRPIWADTRLLGLLFLVSGASAAAAVLLLLGRSRRAGAAPESLHWLERVDTWVTVLELVVLVLVVVSLGSVAEEWLSAWGLVLLVGVVLVGILLPLALHWRPRLLGRMSVPAAAVLALVGGFILRTVIVFSSQAV